jgi:hypothetical protein
MICSCWLMFCCSLLSNFWCFGPIFKLSNDQTTKQNTRTPLFWRVFLRVFWGVYYKIAVTGVQCKFVMSAVFWWEEKYFLWRACTKVDCSGKSLRVLQEIWGFWNSFSYKIVLKNRKIPSINYARNSQKKVPMSNFCRSFVQL